jgi:hypothetical protein
MISDGDLNDLRDLLARMTIEQKLALLVAVKREARNQSRRGPLPGSADDHRTPSYQ